MVPHRRSRAREILARSQIQHSNVLILMDCRNPHHNATMTKKRSYPDDTLLEHDVDTDLRVMAYKPGEEPASKAQPKIDPTYGQRGAFPGLDDGPRDNELFYGPANDGLEYLRMVR